MEKDKILVDRDEFMSQMIKCIGSEEWKAAFEGKSKSELTAAMGGVGFAGCYAAVHTPPSVFTLALCALVIGAVNVPSGLSRLKTVLN